MKAVRHVKEAPNKVRPPTLSRTILVFGGQGPEGP